MICVRVLEWEIEKLVAVACYPPKQIQSSNWLSNAVRHHPVMRQIRSQEFSSKRSLVARNVGNGYGIYVGVKYCVRGSLILRSIIFGEF